ncbi:MAG: pseudouridine synthase, partial [Nitrospiria bacterium]
RGISKLGLASRTEAAGWIDAGRVRVNGVAVRDPSRRIDLDRDRVSVDEADAAAISPLYLAMHKPKGIVTTRADEHGRSTVYDVLAASNGGAWGGAWVFPVGRLDRDSSGLLLLTNDTQWGAGIASPESKIPKMYHVRVRPSLTPQDLERLIAGVPLDEGPAAPIRAEVVRESPRGTWVELTLTEGKNRQIRRICARLGYRVEALVRIRIGSLALGDLRPGDVRELTPDERRGLAARPAVTSR